MLNGELQVGSNKYWLYGTDSSVGCSLIIEACDYDAGAFMLENQDSDEFFMKKRRVDLGLCKVTVESTVLKSDTGKKIKTKLNPSLFCRLGALFQYAKQHCNNKNRRDYLDITSTDQSGDFGSVFDYDIPFPEGSNKSGIFASVTLDYGAVKYIELKVDDFYLKLEESPSEYDGVLLTKITDGWMSAFKQTEDYLGFVVPVAAPIIQSGEFDGMYHSIEEIIEAHPEKELHWLLGKDYKIVHDDELEEVCEYIMNYKEDGKLGLVYYDTETTGLNITFKSRTGDGDQLTGVVLSVKDGESFFFPTRMKKIPNLCGGDDVYFMEHYMRPILEGRDLVTFNGGFDWKVAHIYGINANIVHDVQIIHEITQARVDISSSYITLKGLSKTLLHRDSLELSDLVINDSWGRNSNITFADLPEELVRLYACADTDNTRGDFKYFMQADMLTKFGASKVYEIELAFTFAVAYQEFYGHHLDINNLDRIKIDTDKEMAQKKQEIYDALGYEFNINSPAQLQKALYDDMGIPKQMSSKTGKVTTDSNALKELAALTDIDDKPLYPIISTIIDYRNLESIRKIVDKLPEYMTPDGFIFSRVAQFGTTTGRISVNTPNYQSYSDTVKKNVCPRPGYYMFDTDYSSVEYRVLASMVGNKKIMEAFRDPDFDYHQYQAAHMYNVPYASVTKKLRKAAKGINFGLPYGMGDRSLGIRIFGSDSPENTQKAKRLREAYFKGQEDIRDWFEYHRDKGVNLGYTETYFGRRRYYDKHRQSESKIRREAGNQVIQGTAADIYKLAVGRVFKRICKEGWLGKVLFDGFIHDELMGEVSNDIDPAKFLKVLREEFEVKIVNEKGEPWCPLYMGFGYGTSWYEAKSVELPIKLQWEIVEKYGETGFPTWHKNAREFCDTIPTMLRDFEIEDIKKQITSEEAQGQMIKPALNSALLDRVKDESKTYTEGIKDFFKKENADFDKMFGLGDDLFTEYVTSFEDKLCGYLDENYHIQSLMKDDNGHIITAFEPSKGTQGALDQFCMLHNVNRSIVNVLDIEESDSASVSDLSDAVSSTAIDDEAYKQRALEYMGFHYDVKNSVVTLLLTNNTPRSYLDELRTYLERKPVKAEGDDAEPEINGYSLHFRRYLLNESTQKYEWSTQYTSFYIPFSKYDTVNKLWSRCVADMRLAAAQQ